MRARRCNRGKTNINVKKHVPGSGWRQQWSVLKLVVAAINITELHVGAECNLHFMISCVASYRLRGTFRGALYRALLSFQGQQGY